MNNNLCFDWSKTPCAVFLSYVPDFEIKFHVKQGKKKCRVGGVVFVVNYDLKNIYL